MRCACGRAVLWVHDVNEDRHELSDEATCHCAPAPVCAVCDDDVLRDNVLCAAGLATLAALRGKHAPHRSRLLH